MQTVFTEAQFCRDTSGSGFWHPGFAAFPVLQNSKQLFMTRLSDGLEVLGQKEFVLWLVLL